MKLSVSGSSFTRDARTVHAGACGAVLLPIAGQDFDGANVLRLPRHVGREKFHGICLVWNPRLAEVREGVSNALVHPEKTFQT